MKLDGKGRAQQEELHLYCGPFELPNTYFEFV